jgi:putative aldouronate transport system substrate-binding protein
MKRVCYILAIFIISSTLLSCSQTIKNIDSVNELENDIPAIKLHILSKDTWYNNSQLSDSLPVFKELEKRTGIDLEFETYPSGDMMSLLRIRIMSNEKLPDIIQTEEDRRGVFEAVKYGINGEFIKLEDLIEQHAPDIINLFDKYPYLHKSHIAPDGHIYFLRGYRENFVNGPTMIIRNDWLNDLHLKIPETADEWYNTLLAFKNYVPTGSNAGNVMPFGGNYNFFSSAFGMFAPTDNYYVINDDASITYHALQPEYKDFIIYVKKLYDNGLIDPNLSIGKTDVSTLKMLNLVGSLTGWPGDADNWNTDLNNLGFKEAEYTPILPPKDKNGKVRMSLTNTLTNCYAITKDCSHPKAAIEFLNYIYASKEGTRLMQFGFEGEQYGINENGEVYFLNKFLESSDESVILKLRKIGAFESFMHIQTAELNKARMLGKYAEGIRMFEKALADGHELKQVVSILPAPDDYQNIYNLETVIQMYIDDNTTKFITGQRSIDEYSQFVKALEEYGIYELIDLYEEQYNRYKSLG